MTKITDLSNTGLDADDPDRGQVASGPSMNQLDRPGSSPRADVSDGRRHNMQANRGKNTAPEIAVRRLLHASGYRFRTHLGNLPGKPDIVFTARHKVVEVRGCFWHGHGCSPLGLLPRSRTEYWIPKINGNRERDTRNLASLRDLGWLVAEVWECRIRSEPERVRQELIEFLGPPAMPKVGSLVAHQG